MASRFRACLLCSSGLALTLLSPARLTWYAPAADSLSATTAPAGARPVAPVLAADLDGDGLPEHLSLQGGVARIERAGSVLWSSPLAWQVTQAQVGDLNHDGQPEAVLLVRRPFAPWPIDAYIPAPGRIHDFHDQRGFSCHVILIAWRGDRFGEAWAGSALAEPLDAFALLDRPAGGEALAALESQYDDGPIAPRRVSLWEWNGFGFTLVARSPAGRFTSVIPVAPPNGTPLLLVGGSEGGP
jgi:hypothetical protein